MTEPFDPYHKWLGIRPEERPASHYRLLGISPFEDDQDSIANAADQRMAHVRSFQAGKYGALSQQLLNEISAAKVCLLNAAKKAAYDEQLRRTSLPITKAESLEVVAVEQPAFPERPAEVFDFRAEMPVHKKTKGDRSKQNLNLLAALAAFVIVLGGILAWLLTRPHDDKEQDGNTIAQSSEVETPPPLSSGTMPAASTAKSAPKIDPPKIVPIKPVETAIEPKTMPQAESQTQKPPLKTTPPTASGISNENHVMSLSQAKEQFEKAVASAAKPDDYRDAAKQGMALAKRATAENDTVIASTVAKEALAAARKSGDNDLVKEATLLLITMQAAPTHRPG